MNLKFLFPLTALLITTCTLKGNDIDPFDVGSEHINPYSEFSTINNQPNGPFTLSFDGEATGKSRFESKKNHHKIHFSEGETELGVMVYYNADVTEGVGVNVSETFTNIIWHDNPLFNDGHFNTVSFSLNYFTKRMCKWFWRSQITLNIDGDRFNISDYSNEDFLLWGRYDYCENIRLHVGFIGMSGMKIDRLYPILGLDWKISDVWHLNLVFPVNISIVYTLNDNWSFAAALRTFDSRHRLSKRENLSMGLIEYRNYGGELAANYSYNSWLSVNVHGGLTFAGVLRTATKHYEHIHRRKFKSAGYVGGEVGVNF